jgi:uncharacterized protein
VTAPRVPGGGSATAPARHPGGVHCAALAIELHLPAARSLKAKRATVRPIVEGVRQRYRVAAAEVGFHDQWQRARLGVAAVSGSAAHVVEILDEVERFVWSRPDVDVLGIDRRWLDGEG